MLRFKPFLLLCCVLGSALHAKANTIYVATNGGDSQPSGTQDSPFQTIERAVQEAQAGDTIEVGPGTYTSYGNTNINFTGLDLTLNATAGPASTIIDCSGGIFEIRRAFNFSQGETRAFTVQGFTITGATNSAVSIQDSSPTFKKCIFKNNQAASSSYATGGAIYVTHTSFSKTANPLFENCLFTGNSSSAQSGAVGGALTFEQGSSGTLLNCTLANNSLNSEGLKLGSAIYNLNSNVTVRNCIVYGNTGADAISNDEEGGTTLVTYSDVQKGYGGEGNIDADPLFLSDTDFQLKPTSPAINAGTSSGAPATDLEGVTRPQSLGVDMGAYEYAGFTESLVVTTLTDEDNNTSDPTQGTGTSLREAIRYANVKPGADVITFAPTLSGQLNLQDVLPLPTAPLTITGPANKQLILFQAGNGRLLEIPTSTTVVIKNLTFTNGAIAGGQGGAIKNAGNLTLSSCLFHNNSASGEGGAIYNTGPLIATNCTFSGNASDGYGGGIANVSATALIKNCTLTNNSSATGADNIASYALSGTSTIISNSIVAVTSGNSIGVFGGAPNTFTSQGYNLIGTGGANSVFNKVGDVINVAEAQLNLGPLSYNGGPTKTRAVTSGPALNKGNTDLTVDGRGASRPQGTADDIGAYEYSPTLDELVVTTLVDEDDGTNSSDVGTGRSLREAINAANARGGANAITFKPNLNSTITLTSALPHITGDLQITGNGFFIALSGDNKYQVLYVENSGKLTLSYLTLKNGLGETGGGIANFGSLVMRNCLVTGNAAANGAGLYNEGFYSGGTLLLQNCTFTGNNASSFAGGIFLNSGQSTIENCTVTNNTSGLSSNGILATTSESGPYVTIKNSIVAGNVTGDLIYFGRDSNPYISGGYNLVGGGNGTGVFIQPGDKIIFANSPGLSALAYNGGPTQTMLPLTTSPALNAGDPAFNGTGQTDQRGPGFPRVKFGRLDIGAAEADTNAQPIAVILNPTNNRTLSTAAFKSITGTASSNSGIASVQLKLFRTRGGVTTFWNGSAFTSTQTLLNATLSAPNAPNTNWTYAVAPTLAAALDAGAYSVVVYAKDPFGTTSAAVGTNFSLIVDTTAPVLVITTPSNNQNLSPAGFTAIAGVATDNSDVTSVQIKLFRTRNGASTFWNGSAFTSTQTLFNATLANPGAAGTAWTFAVTPALRAALDNGVYSIVAYGKDAAGNTSGALGRNFSIDTINPVATITNPTQNQAVALQSFASINGTATDNSGVAQVQIKLFRVRDGVTTFWNGTAFTTTDVRLATQLSTPNGTSTNWTYPISADLKELMGSGTYNIVAYAVDTAGNTSSAAGRNFSTYNDTAPPGVTISTPGQNQSLTAAAFTGITGSASDNIGVTGVQFKLFRSRNGVIQYWNGSAFTSTVVLLNANLNPVGGTAPTWSYSVPATLRSALDVGTYNIVAYAKDAANNQSAGVGRTFSITSVSGALTAPPTSVSGQEF